MTNTQNRVMPPICYTKARGNYSKVSTGFCDQTTVCNEIRKSYILYVYIGARKADTPINP